MTRTSTFSEDFGPLSIIAAAVVIACLYFARVVFIPIALALLVSLLLTPEIIFLERIKLPRLFAIFLVVVSFVGLAGLVGWESSEQFIDLTNQLPAYKSNLDDKIRALRGYRSQNLNKAAAKLRLSLDRPQQTESEREPQGQVPRHHSRWQCK